jgi:hypothetical protein
VITKSKTLRARELGISRGSLYYKQKKPEKNWILKCDIETVLREHPSYGSPRIALHLKRNHKPIERVMKLFGICRYCDNGSEYDSDIFIQILHTVGISIFRSAPGCPWENGYQESFYDKFKIDLGDPNRFETLGELVYEIYHTIYIYNTTRIHTSLKMSPVQFALKVRESYNI